MNSVINYCLGLGYYDLENFAGKNFLVVYNYIKNNSRVNPNDVLIPTIFTCIASDGQLTSLEKKFVCDLFNVDAATVDGIFKSINSEIIRIVHEVFDSIPTDEVKAALLSFCACFLAVDERVTREEFAFLQKLIA